MALDVGGYRQINKALNICAFEDYLKGQQSSLPKLQDVEQISPRVVRVLRPNSGKVSSKAQRYILSRGVSLHGNKFAQDERQAANSIQVTQGCRRRGKPSIKLLLPSLLHVKIYFWLCLVSHSRCTSTVYVTGNKHLHRRHGLSTSHYRYRAEHPRLGTSYIFHSHHLKGFIILHISHTLAWRSHWWGS